MATAIVLNLGIILNDANKKNLCEVRISRHCMREMLWARYPQLKETGPYASALRKDFVELATHWLNGICNDYGFLSGQDLKTGDFYFLKTQVSMTLKIAAAKDEIDRVTRT